MDHILGRKLGMTRLFLDNGNVVGVTVVQAGPCVVTALRTPTKDGYEAVQVGFEEAMSYKKPEARKKDRMRPGAMLSSPRSGYFKKRDIPAKRYLREFRESASGVEIGQTVTAAIFAKDEFVDVTGITKGKGFQGGVRRDNLRVARRAWDFEEVKGDSSRHRGSIWGYVGIGGASKRWRVL